ncbi:hypothetical protein NDU88_005791 [Pleurodeles waltl]|uniref:Uncharacterized protein n=1 Tax=Pleurodeles waltl TaxID=8319 RepID=A0AAV7N0E0_PLEWA|nr:hypothetical protein NDU88_005791 [Pleurodeles waltl]
MAMHEALLPWKLDAYGGELQKIITVAPTYQWISGLLCCRTSPCHPVRVVRLSPRPSSGSSGAERRKRGEPYLLLGSLQWQGSRSSLDSRTLLLPRSWASVNAAHRRSPGVLRRFSSRGRRSRTPGGSSGSPELGSSRPQEGRPQGRRDATPPSLQVIFFRDVLPAGRVSATGRCSSGQELSGGGGIPMWVEVVVLASAGPPPPPRDRYRAELGV